MDEIIFLKNFILKYVFALHYSNKRVAEFSSSCSSPFEISFENKSIPRMWPVSEKSLSKLSHFPLGKGIKKTLGILLKKKNMDKFNHPNWRFATGEQNAIKWERICLKIFECCDKGQIVVRLRNEFFRFPMADVKGFIKKGMRMDGLKIDKEKWLHTLAILLILKKEEELMAPRYRLTKFSYWVCVADGDRPFLFAKIGFGNFLKKFKKDLRELSSSLMSIDRLTGRREKCFDKIKLLIGEKVDESRAEVPGLVKLLLGPKSGSCKNSRNVIDGRLIFNKYYGKIDDKILKCFIPGVGCAQNVDLNRIALPLSAGGVNGLDPFSHYCRIFSIFSSSLSIQWIYLYSRSYYHFSSSRIEKNGHFCSKLSEYLSVSHNHHQ